MKQQKGGSEMLEGFYRDNYRIVYGYLLSLCGDPAWAEELTAEAFLKALERIDTYDPKYRATTWLCTIGRNLYLDEVGRKGKIEPLEEAMASLAPSPEDALIQNEMLKAFWLHARKLKDRSRHVLLMRLGGMSFREIGLALGVTENSARVTYFRAKAQILSEMEDWK
jgi:RNA polymerase sigma-70 factor (ECF subfamily)